MVNRSILLKPSVIVWIVANVIPLWGVFFRGWDVSNILHLYWVENVVVGVVTLLKILSNGEKSASFPAKVFLGGFFTVPYGFFCFGHARFVFGSLRRLDFRGALIDPCNHANPAHRENHRQFVLPYEGAQRGRGGQESIY
ncbi:MAG: DUF6498-containing protein [Akkermansiaceae bacterium]|jgi:hypothetical protein